MAIKARKPQSDFIPAPAGTHLAVCVDVVDNGDVKSSYNGQDRIQPKVTFRWETMKNNPKNGKPFLIQQRYTNSTHAKANLGKMLAGWFGRPLTRQETSGEFDLETLIGTCGLVSVMHNERDGVVYANVQNVSPLMEGMSPIAPSADYVRVVNRPAEDTGQTADYTDGEDNPPPPTDADYQGDPLDDSDESLPF